MLRRTTNFKEAIERFDEDKFRELCSTHKSQIPTSTIFFVVQKGFVAGLHILQELGIDLQCKDSCGRNIFHCACQYGKIELVKFFLEDTRFKHMLKEFGRFNRQYEDALDIAMSYDKKDVVTLLLGSGYFDVNKSVFNASRLFKALSDKNDRVAKYLIEYGADISVSGYHRPYRKISSVCLAAKLLPNILNTMVQRGANINETHDGQSLLMLAMTDANRETICSLVKSGADVEFKDKDGKTCFDYMSNEEQLYGILDAGIHISSIETKFKFPTLHWALSHCCRSNQALKQIVTFLLNHEANMNIIPEGEDPIIMKALKCERYNFGERTEYEHVKELIKFGADVNQTDVDGLSVIEVFVDSESKQWRASPSFGYFLLESGAKPDCNLIKIFNHVKGDPAVCEWTKFAIALLEKGASPNGKSTFNGDFQCCSGLRCLRAKESYLKSICMKWSNDLCIFFLELLIGHAASIGVVDYDKKSCLDVLIEHLCNEIICQIHSLEVTADINIDCRSVELLVKAGGEQLQIPGNSILRTLLEHGLFKTTENIIRSGWLLQFENTLIKEIETDTFVAHENIVKHEDLIEKFKHFVDEVTTHPLPLKSICRNTIRRQMIIASNGQSIRPLIERLPLPKTSRNFVGLEDIDWVSTEVITANPPPRIIGVSRWRDSDDYDDYDDDDYDYSPREVFFNTETDEFEPAWW